MSWFTRLRNAIFSKPLDEELDEEMRDHLERRIDRLVASGTPRSEAERAVKLRFGNLTRVHEESRETRLAGFVESAIQDVRYALRLMRKSPGFTATVIASLGLAIGANTAIFSILDAAMLRPLPVTAPDQLVSLAWPGIQEPGREPEPERESFSYPQLVRFREASKGFARLALFSFPGEAEVHGVEPDAPVEHVVRQHVSGDAFDILGVTPVLGRLIAPEDDTSPGAHPVIVLGYDYWQHHFRGDPAVLGRQMIVEGIPSTIIGVAREGFFGVQPGKIVDVYRPAMEYNKNAITTEGWSWFQILGRLEPGASREQLQSRLQPILKNFVEGMVKQFATMPPVIRDQFLSAKIRVKPAPAGMSRFRNEYGRPLWIMLGVAVAIFLIACSNVASLLLARATSRASEVAMRLSLGAGRARLIRQLLTESLILSLLAGLSGWLIAKALMPAVVASLSTTTENVDFVLPMNTTVLFATIVASLAAAILFGFAPAWQASRAQPAQVMRATAGQASRQRMGRLFVAVQVAFAFALVMLGAAFLLSFRNLTHVPMGFSAHGVTGYNIRVSEKDLPDETKLQLVSEMSERIGALPGVTAVASARWSLFVRTSWTEQILVPGQPPSEREELFYPVSSGYFKTLGTPLLAGREFARTDYSKKDDTPAIVNLAFASRYFPGVDPVGRRFRYPSAKTSLLIVGVAGNSHYGDLRRGSDPMVYVPFGGDNDLLLYVRSESPLTFTLVDREVRQIRPGMRVARVYPLESLINDTILRERLLAVTGGTLGVLGLVLAAIGLFGLLNYTVERRTKEIGIRAALGARYGQIVSLVVRETIASVAAGLIAGAAAAVFVLASLDKILFNVRAADPIVVAAAVALFLLAALIAAGLPARRAASVDPMTALRVE